MGEIVSEKEAINMGLYPYGLPNVIGYYKKRTESFNSEIELAVKDLFMRRKKDIDPEEYKELVSDL